MSDDIQTIVQKIMHNARRKRETQARIDVLHTVQQHLGDIAVSRAEARRAWALMDRRIENLEHEVER